MMFPQEILARVLAMPPAKLTAKVAQLKGWKLGVGRDYWVMSKGHICALSWSPPTSIADAWPLWEEIERDCKEARLYAITYDREGPHLWKYHLCILSNDFGRFGPLAITCAWLWWKWCEKEGTA